VKGWRIGTDWLNSATLLARNNFAENVALGSWSRQGSRPNRGATTIEAPGPVIVTAPYSEEAAIAVAGGPGAATVAATFTIADNPDGMKNIVLSGPEAKPSSKSTPPPPPEGTVDPIAILYATKPKDVTALVARMSELLYGDRISTTQTAKLEKFLREPLTPLKDSPSQPKGGPKPTGKGKKEAVPQTPVKKTEEAAPKKDAMNSGPPDLDSPEFKARVRETLHAMMCLPEYQLN
jgi:hypothetical protein